MCLDHGVCDLQAHLWGSLHPVHRTLGHMPCLRKAGLEQTGAHFKNTQHHRHTKEQRGLILSCLAATLTGQGDLH